MPSRAPARPLACALAVAVALAGSACDKDRDAHLLVVVTASGTPAGVTLLNVTLDGPGGVSAKRYTRAASEVIDFPTTLAATLPPNAAGAVSLEVVARDAAGATVATGHAGPITVAAGESKTAYVQLDCAGEPCVATGPGGPDGGVPDASPRCGNGLVDPGETCDTAIAPGDPGACPPASCDDHVPCTRDTHSGAGCTAVCTHEEIVRTDPNDGCCPAETTSDQDPDCSSSCGNGSVEPGETCDTGIAQGTPGACANQRTCSDADACATTKLVSAGTCSAVCVRYPKTAQVQASTLSDGCCPAGATSASDGDCPVVCGNGIAEAGETCDVGIPAPAAGGCPASCDDGVPGTRDMLTGSGCQASCVHTPITAWISGDGFCPPGATSATDTDCAPSCGNGIIDPGEACDKNAPPGSDIACPTSCPPSPTATLRGEGCIQIRLIGSAADCSARCLVTEVSTPSMQPDTCCPSGATFANDADCSIPCGDGLLQPSMGETCDTLLPPGTFGACPTSCSFSGRCTESRLVSAGTCAATCVPLAITGFRAGDGCCPPGGNFTVDPDCDIQCGNGIVEQPAERCDRAAGNGSCPLAASQCPAADACTTISFQGAPATCTAECVAVRTTTCRNSDGCCPTGCSAAADNDCPAICGNEVVEVTERCDRGITAGAPGSCPRSCDDGDACTVDVVSGSVEACTRTCTYRDVTACLTGDGCCPAGCTPATDEDCARECGDNRVGPGETCDPSTTCPTTCPDDGDPCTREQLVGDPNECTAACRHVPITACSGSTRDACCPTGCGQANDTDC